MLRDRIYEVRAALKWKVIEVHEPPRAMEIISDPWLRTHSIYLPHPDDDWRDIEYLHELAHAYLAETIHPLLSTAYFVPGTLQALIDLFVWPKRTASDWFADHLLMIWCPDEERSEIAEHAALVAKAPDSSNPAWRFGAGLMFAQAAQYRTAHPPVPREAAPVVEILRSIRPDSPNLRNMRRLTNRLAALVTRYQLSVAENGGVEVWRIDRG